jgi:hypothetical protein
MTFKQRVKDWYILNIKYLFRTPYETNGREISCEIDYSDAEQRRNERADRKLSIIVDRELKALKIRK